MRLLGAILLDEIAEDTGNVVFDDEIFLVEAFEQTAAQAVDGDALLVHDVVVLEQVFAGFEVLAFDRLLRGLDATRNHPRFDRHAFFHAEALKQVRDPLLGEDAHQVVFK